MPKNKVAVLMLFVASAFVVQGVARAEDKNPVKHDEKEIVKEAKKVDHALKKPFKKKKKAELDQLDPNEAVASANGDIEVNPAEEQDALLKDAPAAQDAVSAPAEASEPATRQAAG